MYDNESLHADSTPETPARPEETTNAATPAVPEGPAAHSPRHAAAGRKGAHRVHELIEQGKLYEKEHGLKRGRQRLRQLIEEGRLYEEEHGLRPRRKRTARASSGEALDAFFQALVRLVRPNLRARLVQVVEALKAETKS
jgi:hypothetical protein